MEEPLWLTRGQVEAIHVSQIREHGGSHGLREAALLESALARPKHKLHHEPESDLLELAAAYGFGLIRSRPFMDGNERTGLAGAAAFLLVNGWELRAEEPEAVVVIRDIASGELGEAELVAWLRQRSEAVRE
jgi:death-on-curing protein